MTFKHVVCGVCGTDFGITDSLFLLVNQKRKKIYCPHGHSLGEKINNVSSSPPPTNVLPAMPDTREYLNTIGVKGDENNR